MAGIKVDLNKLRDEIQSEKTKVLGVPQRMGVATGQFSTPKHEFLNGLMTSLKTGQETPSSILLKEVDNTAELKQGGKVKARVPINNNNVKDEYYEPKPKQRPLNMLTESPDREENMYRDFEKMKKQTLAEALSDGINMTNQNQQPRYNNQNQPMQTINEQVIAENVRGAVNSYLAESLMPILEESTRSVVIEMYAQERLKKVLIENKDMIKEYIVEVFRELKAKQR